jgi:hypothetical protein
VILPDHKDPMNPMSSPRHPSGLRRWIRPTQPRPPHRDDITCTIPPQRPFA